MNPIEQVKPALPGNWTRRPENRNKQGGPGKVKDKDPKDKGPSGHGPGEGPGRGEHIVDELA
jgi:hypothetical protein